MASKPSEEEIMTHKSFCEMQFHYAKDGLLSKIGTGPNFIQSTGIIFKIDADIFLVPELNPRVRELDTYLTTTDNVVRAKVAQHYPS
ncbi:hypothetical protein Fmac_015439 [Flemingia macrophylla]|uniref:Uncharacterized protein n=1 Tax=Flemingia macrophylla TaxID=520843 RepID=A0ABD1MEK5_9FABA